MWTAAKTITGATEGAYGWLSINFITGNLNKSIAEMAAGVEVTTPALGEYTTLGALDLGGASTQVPHLPLQSNLNQRSAAAFADGFLWVSQITFLSKADVISDAFSVNNADQCLLTSLTGMADQRWHWHQL